MSDVFSQSGTARAEIYNELASLRLTDPHTHINPHSPASTTLADLLGYHYYTELAHSAGMAKSRIEDKSIGPKELVERLVGGLAPLENTVQYSWLMEICRMFFGFDEDRLHVNNWEALYDHSESIMSSAQWPDMVLDQSNVEAVFLTNDFDDDLAGFDSDRYIPCLRTDDLVFHLADPVVRERLAKCTGLSLDGSLSSLRQSLRALFVHFTGRGARACAISLPPGFTPTSVADGRAQTALDAVLRGGITADASHREALSRRVFWTLAELCDEFSLPFDLMIGVNRKVYPGGVYQGQDLFDSRVSLIQYRDLFNTFLDVKFPVSVLASVTNQELVSYAWIFPNVIPNGHWWYSNTPSTITHDLAARLEAVPQTKMIGYYSDAYKLEFVWPKFNMYRKVLAGVLADQFVRDRGWSVERAVALGCRVLKDNTEDIFPRRGHTQATPSHRDPGEEPNTQSLGTLVTSGVAEAGLGGAAAVAGAAVAGAAVVASKVVVDVLEELTPQSSAADQPPTNESSQEQDPSSEELAEIELHDPVTDIQDELEEAQEDSGELFDTVVIDPVQVSPSDMKDDLGSAGDQPLEHPTTAFAEDSAATVIEDRPAHERPPAEPPLPDILDWDDGAFESETAEGHHEESPIETDPLPMDDEIGELGLDDVELIDPSDEPIHDADSIATVLDDEPLDLDDPFDDDEPFDDDDAPQIKQLRGETSFSPDEESLQLQSDPLTGELRLNSPAEPESSEMGESAPAESSDAQSSADPKSNKDEFNLSWLEDDEESSPQG